ncbi:MAG: hypothetical protein HY700_03180 [Gemmatimonadetes bacterium]|nr:hypothetical protein [Gemmatimonadota bacterium]
MKAAGMVLVVLGILALVYGGFSYTKETHDADLGPLKVQVKDQERVNVPVWAGVAAIVGGALVLLGAGSKSVG